MSSLFGNLDITEVPDDPFYTAPNTYWATCLDAVQKEKDGNVSLVITWAIDEPDSDYHGNRLSQYFRLYPDRQFNTLDANEKKSLSFLKKTLREGFDLSESEMLSVEPSQLQGYQAFITVVTRDGTGENEGKKFSNINQVLCKRLYDEQNQSSEMASNLGL